MDTTYIRYFFSLPHKILLTTLSEMYTWLMSMLSAVSRENKIHHNPVILSNDKEIHVLSIAMTPDVMTVGFR